MSFFTTLKFYRPTAPPPVTADDLWRFIARLYDMGTLLDSGLKTLEVKFGDAIDQDDRPAFYEEEIMPGLSRAQERGGERRVPKH